MRPPDPTEPSRITQILIDAYESKNMKGVIGKLYKGLSVMNKNLRNYKESAGKKKPIW